MIRCYIKDNEIVKIVKDWFFTKEQQPEHDTYIDADFNIYDNVKLEGWNIILDASKDIVWSMKPKEI